MTVETRILGEVRKCPYHPGRIGIDRHPCGAADRETGETCGYFEGKAELETLPESRIISGQLDLLNTQVELELSL